MSLKHPDFPDAMTAGDLKAGMTVVTRGSGPPERRYFILATPGPNAVLVEVVPDQYFQFYSKVQLRAGQVLPQHKWQMHLRYLGVLPSDDGHWPPFYTVPAEDAEP